MYVGGLPYSTTSQALQDAFAAAGAVESATIITDRMSGRSRGFGFVEMVNDDDGAKAVEMFNGKDFEGRTLIVNEARPMKERAAGGDGGGFRPRRPSGPGGFRGRSDRQSRDF